jgi:hypothetical protein
MLCLQTCAKETSHFFTLTKVVEQNNSRKDFSESQTIYSHN